jgi:hypothetical protein
MDLYVLVASPVLTVRGNKSSLEAGDDDFRRQPLFLLNLLQGLDEILSELHGHASSKP